MGKGRLEAFSDGVIAIIITIMVLELKVPHGASFNDLLPLLPVLGSYVLSFIYVGIYWNKLQCGCYPPIIKKGKDQNRRTIDSYPVEQMVG